MDLGTDSACASLGTFKLARAPRTAEGLGKPSSHMDDYGLPPEPLILESWAAVGAAVNMVLGIVRLARSSKAGSPRAARASHRSGRSFRWTSRWIDLRLLISKGVCACHIEFNVLAFRNPNAPGWQGFAAMAWSFCKPARAMLSFHRVVWPHRSRAVAAARPAWARAHQLTDGRSPQ